MRRHHEGVENAFSLTFIDVCIKCASSVLLGLLKPSKAENNIEICHFHQGSGELRTMIYVHMQN